MQSGQIYTKVIFLEEKVTFPTLNLVHLGVSYDFSTRKWQNDHDGNPVDKTLWGQNPDDYPIQPQMDDIIGDFFDV